MPKESKPKRKKKATRKRSGLPRDKTGRFAPNPELRQKTQDYREQMAMCRRRLMTSCSESALGDIINKLLRDCTHRRPDVRHSAMRLLFDRVFGKAPIFIESKHEQTTRYIKEIILTTPEKARPAGFVEQQVEDKQVH